MKHSVRSGTGLWATAISVSALYPHAAPAAIGVVAVKEGFDLLRARALRATVVAYIRASGSGTYLSIDQSEAAPGITLETAPPASGPPENEKGAVPVPAEDEPSGCASRPDPGEFCTKHRADWVAYALVHARNRQDAEDAVSHAVEKILRYHRETGMICPPKYDDPVAWSKTVIANYIKDIHRHDKVTDKYLQKLYSPPGDFTDDVIDQMIAAQADYFLRELKSKDHQIAVLYYMENRSPAEIARELGRNVITVRTSLWRTRVRLRKRLGVRAEPPRAIPREKT
jgi:RNA polymerase sigma factor (sigma-70 family)